ncbi:DNA ligase D-like protein (predicted 3'-phosphoesterase) [Catalinimonas alkaloidigena]|uniref:DNA polymerase ligase N-terminal domain-containing protein n=1 Tax=Catalinimonas alkaloidigena TaxID=1075417 RepID=UPI0024075C0D|nr:DNA polymerase ligase N-terminal domain-containing protein [Catalinimonas alkaloidigena]MDF9796643.1 DNA ligase D-like protein (predicted 3'-phosphoesterase) [Catalinimonas alkaloidigena]
MNQDEYQAKRDFKRTNEPQGNTLKKDGHPPIFVIQKHDASTLHYDFRLEIGGTLKSWAVPKGPSNDPAIKRMAIPTEDHPMDYAWFEGPIPEGEYGGGTVMIWDKGSFDNLKTDKEGNKISLEDSYEQGNVEIFLKGERLRGGYAIIKMKSGRMAGNWLLTKMKDEHANPDFDPVKTANRSVVSGKTMEEIAKGMN